MSRSEVAAEARSQRKRADRMNARFGRDEKQSRCSVQRQGGETGGGDGLAA